MIFITSDTHGQYERFKEIKRFCKEHHTTPDDTMIILGDSGINYYEDERDCKLKNFISTIPITFFCIHGNHEQRPEEIKGIEHYRYSNSKYPEYDFLNSDILKEEKYPNIKYGIDSYTYYIEGKPFLVFGGGYSIDKDYRILKQKQGLKDYKYWTNELPSKKTIEDWKEDLNVLFLCNPNIEWNIISHTCPKKYIPYEAFLPNIDQSKVDTTLEEFLDYVEEKINYNRWYCGHFHINKKIDKLNFIYNNILGIDF